MAARRRSAHRRWRLPRLNGSNEVVDDPLDRAGIDAARHVVEVQLHVRAAACDGLLDERAQADRASPRLDDAAANLVEVGQVLQQLAESLALASDELHQLQSLLVGKLTPQVGEHG